LPFSRSFILVFYRDSANDCVRTCVILVLRALFIRVPVFTGENRTRVVEHARQSGRDNVAEYVCQYNIAVSLSHRNWCFRRFDNIIIFVSAIAPDARRFPQVYCSLTDGRGVIASCVIYIRSAAATYRR
jgi:hypothetical protein